MLTLEPAALPASPERLLEQAREHLANSRIENRIAHKHLQHPLA